MIKGERKIKEIFQGALSKLLLGRIGEFTDKISIEQGGSFMRSPCNHKKVQVKDDKLVKHKEIQVQDVEVIKFKKSSIEMEKNEYEHSIVERIEFFEPHKIVLHCCYFHFIVSAAYIYLDTNEIHTRAFAILTLVLFLCL